MTSLWHGIVDLKQKLEDNCFVVFKTKDVLKQRISDLSKIPMDYIQINSNMPIDKLIIIE